MYAQLELTELEDSDVLAGADHPPRLSPVHNGCDLDGAVEPERFDLAQGEIERRRGGVLVEVDAFHSALSPEGACCDSVGPESASPSAAASASGSSVRLRPARPNRSDTSIPVPK